MSAPTRAARQVLSLAGLHPTATARRRRANPERANPGRADPGRAVRVKQVSGAKAGPRPSQAASPWSRVQTSRVLARGTQRLPPRQLKQGLEAQG